MTLRSSDGVDFRIDSIVLRRASGLFEDLFKLPQSHIARDGTPETILMEETSDVLNILLRSLYPTLPPTIAPEAQGEALIRAVDRLDFSIYSLDRALDELLTSMHPIRAWVLAVRYGRSDARKLAVERYLTDKEYAPSQDLVELEHLNGQSIAALLRIKQRAIQQAAKELDKLHWCCCTHFNSEWYLNQTAKMTATPFNLVEASDERLYAVLAKAKTEEDCALCIKYFRGCYATSQRERVRGTIAGILAMTVQIECGSMGTCLESADSFLRIIAPISTAMVSTVLADSLTPTEINRRSYSRVK